MNQQLAHIAIVVDDYDKAIEFYTQKLHFELIEDTIYNDDATIVNEQEEISGDNKDAIHNKMMCIKDMIKKTKVLQFNWYETDLDDELQAGDDTADATKIIYGGLANFFNKIDKVSD